MFGQPWNNAYKMGEIALWPTESAKKQRNYRKICILSAIAAFIIGLTVGILIPIMYFRGGNGVKNMNNERNSTIKTEKLIGSVFINNSFSFHNNFSSVSFIEFDGYIENDVFWGKKIEEALPKGYADEDNKKWNKYVKNTFAVRLQPGCGRMQNRLVTFQDGTKGCVRYRQNLDQIQGELFSFYLAQLLQLPNLVPSAVSLIDLTSQTWHNIATEIASAQWVSNRPVVITKFISDLGSANIPKSFRPPETQLNRREILKNDNQMSIQDLIELAQWSDLVIFDYLTGNLDRIVNNLYNRQWNVNIMDAPAHNLARRSSNDLLMFLDNESGLLHGYRLLQKYESYHILLLENLCVFRRNTIAALERLRRDQNVGKLLLKMFEMNTGLQIRDVLPALPDKSVKILNERLDRVHDQITRCKKQNLR